MNRPPRPTNQPLVNRFGIWRIAFISGVAAGLHLRRLLLAHAPRSLAGSGLHAVAVNAMIIGQVFYLVNSRYLFESCFSVKAFTGNWLVPAAIGGVVVLQLLFTYVPFMNGIFGSAPPAIVSVEMAPAGWRCLLRSGRTGKSARAPNQHESRKGRR